MLNSEISTLNPFDRLLTNSSFSSYINSGGENTVATVPEPSNLTLNS